MRVRPWLPLAGPLLVVMALLASACPGPGYPRCENDQQCADRQEVCVYGQCLECALDNQCGPGRICRNYHCENRPTCSSDKDCKDGKVCKAGTCEFQCVDNSGCTAPQVCENNQCVLPKDACTDHSNCPKGQACREGRCFSPVPGDPEYEAIYGPVTPAPEATSGVDVIGPRTLCGTEVRVYFGFNESVITDEGRELLGKAATCLKENPGLNVTVLGHTDERGSTEFNLALGERRAFAIQAYLKNLGIAPERVVPVSVGEERPLDPGRDEAAYAKNRRGELVPRTP